MLNPTVATFSPGAWDHALALLVAVALPIYSARSYPSVQRQIAAEGEPARLALYREAIAWPVGWTAVLLALWAWQGRGWGELGLGRVATGVGSLISLGLLALVLAFMARQWRAVVSGKVDLSQAAEQVDNLGSLIPETDRERTWFRATAIAVGIGEELVWRGFMIWYLSGWLGLWGAGLASAVLFTLGHLYQGWRQLPGLLVGSVLLTVVRLLTGSVWVPMLAHAATDIFQGELVAEVRRRLRVAGGS